jgi:hypothetical protein
VGGFLENVHKIRNSSSWWTKILELGVFSGKNIPVAVGTLLDPKRNSIKAKGLFEKRHAGTTRDVGSTRSDGRE